MEPNEIVTEIFIPTPQPWMRSSYRKVRARGSWDFALAAVALALRFEGPRVLEAKVWLSGAAPVPWRSKEAEEEIVGRNLDKRTIGRASEAALRTAEPLAKNGYKIPPFKTVVEEELERIANL